MKLNKIIVLLIAVLFVTLASAQSAQADKPTDNMQILRDAMKANKKLVVADGMQLSDSEAKGFWPVYEAYQKDLEKLDVRAVALIKSYADAWNSSSMDNEKAKKLTSDFLAIQADEVKLIQSYVPKLNKVLPATKVARYLQIENKLRAIIRYDLAAKIPLVPAN